MHCICFFENISSYLYLYLYVLSVFVPWGAPYSHSSSDGRKYSLSTQGGGGGRAKRAVGPASLWRHCLVRVTPLAHGAYCTFSWVQYFNALMVQSLNVFIIQYLVPGTSLILCCGVQSCQQAFWRHCLGGERLIEHFHSRFGFRQIFFWQYQIIWIFSW